MNKKSHVVISQCMWYLEDIAGIVFGQWHTRLANFSVDNFENKINIRIVSASAWYRLMIQQKLWKEDEKEIEREKGQTKDLQVYKSEEGKSEREMCGKESIPHGNSRSYTAGARSKDGRKSTFTPTLFYIYTARLVEVHDQKENVAATLHMRRRRASFSL